MRLALFLLLLCTAAVVRAESPEMAELREQYRQQLIAEAERQPDLGIDAMQQLAGRIAEQVYAGHGEVLRRESLDNWSKLPELPSGRLEGYVVKSTVSDFPELRRQPSTLMLYGIQPATLATSIVNYVAIGQGQAGGASRFMLRNLVGAQYFRESQREGYFVIVRSLNDYFRVELALTDRGVFEPKRVEWLVKPAATTAPAPASTRPASQ